MKLSELIAAMERIAPTRYAESWDNVGLLVGDADQALTRAMLTIDYTPDVAAEAKDKSCDAIVAYHPPIFEALKRIGGDSLIFDAIRRGVAIYSPHTALDVAAGGTNDMLADVLGLVDRQPLRPAPTKASQYKLVVFVPEKEVDRVAGALFAAGAGRIGNYSSCSFRSSGTGTFFGEAGADPAVGQAGRLERTAEIRLETLVPMARLAAVIEALRKTHPYEEPAFDLNQLAAAPEGLGMGRIGTPEKPIDRPALFARIKRELDLPHLLIAGPETGPVRKAACCAGACGELLNDAIAQNVDVYLTGEMRHHDAIKAARAGVSVVCTLHSNSERAVLKRVRDRLGEILPDLAVLASDADREPFAVR